MEVAGTVMSAAQTLFAALQSSELKKVISVFGYESELEELQNTVSTIQAVFQDAEKRQTLSPVELKLIEDLKDAVYEADDLLDEFVTLSEQKQLIKANGSISKKMQLFISRNNPFVVAYKMSERVKKIRKKLDAIVGNNRFNFVHNPEPIRNRRPETCSYVNEVDIIGRGEDLEKIVGMFLDPNSQQDLSFLSIVGIGGMGKTALAQLVYNDPRVTSLFPLRLWACVSDQDQKQLDVKEVLTKILASMNQDEGSTLVQKQSKLHQQLSGKRYLLVLDDVWTEKREEWLCLVQYFVGGQSGSWIVVTTRSQETARIIGDKNSPMHELQGLSEVDSLCLFKRVAFGPEELNSPVDEDLIELGREIVDGCVRVPLAIRVVGSLLYCQEKSKWRSMKEIGLANIRKSENYGLMSILQLSYHHLEPPLKNCFKYCALFPKDFDIQKKMLTDIWIALDYVVPFYEGQSVDDACEEYFSILVKRCFFQDFKRGENGEIVFCKMHDLIHDVALSVSGKEIFVASTEITKFNKNVLHFLILKGKFGKLSSDKNHARSCILLDGDYYDQILDKFSFVKSLLSRCRYLRVLNLERLNMISLPKTLTTSLHLRYLDLSGNKELELLPNSISNLYNLQTLKLNHCYKLQELPQDLSKLVKLRVLEIILCDKLKFMPRGMERLTCLSRLSNFIVGREESFENWKEWFDGLEELKALNGLKGELEVNIKWPKNAVTLPYIEKGHVLRSKDHLNNISIKFQGFDEDDVERMEDEGWIALMKDLHPPPHLMRLVIWNYNGTRMPNWASHLPNLVKLQLWYCNGLEEWRGGTSSSGNNQQEDMQSQLPCLPHLKSLLIFNCEQLTWIPLCPKLELLDLSGFNERLVIGEEGHTYASTSSQEVANWGGPKFKDIRLNSMVWLNSVPMEAFHYLERLKIKHDEKVEKFGEVGEMFRSCSSSLRKLKISWCSKLRSVVGGGLEHLAALQELEFDNCENLDLLEEEMERDGGVMRCPCPSLLPSLRTLQLWKLQKLENMPNWMQLLTALQTLEIRECINLKAMPKWMPKLNSLRSLLVWRCSESIKRRCEKEPQGEDWPLIQHIPSVIFKASCQ